MRTLWGWKWDDSETAFFGDGQVAIPCVPLGENGLGETNQVVGRPQAGSEEDHARGGKSTLAEGEFAEVLVEGQ